MKALLLALTIVVGGTVQAETFSMTPYLKQCGGKIYSKCDSKDLNQQTIFEEARKEAQAKTKQLLVVFGADWCPSCVHFAKILETDKDATLFHSKFVVVKLNGDLESAKNVSRQLKISVVGFPQAYVVSTKPEVVQQFYPSRYGSLKAILDIIGQQKQDLAVKPAAIDDKVLTTSLEKPIELTSDYGTSSFIPNAKSNDEKFVNQGIAALQVFHYLDAYRSFKEAERANPNSILAYAGQIISILQMGQGEDAFYFANVAYKAAEGLLQNTKVSEKERAWLSFARVLQIANSGNYIRKAGDPVKSMDEVIFDIQKADSKNLDGLALLTWLTYSSMNQRQIRENLDAIVKKDPKNIGANHYLLHLAEMDNDEKKAEVHGQALATLAPRSAHAVHMYGHTLPQKGRWKDALEYFQKADLIHQQWAQKNGFTLDQDWHYSHNLDLMAATYLGLGHFEKAKELWKASMFDDPRAAMHYISVVLATETPERVTAAMKPFLRNGWGRKVAPLVAEIDLTKGNVAQFKGSISQRTGKYDVLVHRIADAYLAGKADSKLSNDLTAYFSERLKSGGFDGWSNAYLELLRIKRIANILSMDWIIKDTEALTIAVQNGSLCSSAMKAKSLIRCFESAKD